MPENILWAVVVLFFALFIPLMQTFLLGYAIDTNVRHVRTGVVDHARTQESREFLQGLVNTDDFDIVAEFADEASLHREIVSGRIRVGVLIPADYSRKLQAGESAQVLVLVDGSESSVAGEVLNVSNALALRESLGRVAPGGKIVLYTGAAVVDGCDRFREQAEVMCRAAGASFDYAELDPDVFGSELDQPAYAGVERIAAVGLVVTLPS